MKNNILKQYYLDTEKYYLDMNKEKASAILEECKKFRIYHKYDKDNPLNNLLLNYMKMKEKNKEAVLDDILDKYGINYNSSVQSAISYLLNDSCSLRYNRRFFLHEKLPLTPLLSISQGIKIAAAFSIISKVAAVNFSVFFSLTNMAV